MAVKLKKGFETKKRFVINIRLTPALRRGILIFTFTNSTIFGRNFYFLI
jgi:hypothetical protein